MIIDEQLLKKVQQEYDDLGGELALNSQEFQDYFGFDQVFATEIMEELITTGRFKLVKELDSNTGETVERFQIHPNYKRNYWLKADLEEREAEILLELGFQLKNAYYTKGNIFTLKNIEIKDDHVIGLNLSNLNLTSLPESIGELSELKILILTDNELTSLPKFLLKLRKLEQLSLNNNPIQYEKTDLQALQLNLHNLTHLWIGGKNHLKCRICRQICLNIGKREICCLCKGLDPPYCKHCRKNASNKFGIYNGVALLQKQVNFLVELEKIIGRPIPQIYRSGEMGFRTPFGDSPEYWTVSYLCLSNTDLERLPDSINHLINLQTIILRDNRLESVPPEIGELKRLSTVDLSNNQLKETPRSIWELGELSTLDLSHNQLSSLPETIGQLKRLNTLNLSYNQLSSLPETIGQLKRLNDLNLSYNQISSLPETIGELDSLAIFNISHNLLSSVPSTITNLERIRTIDVRRNRFITFPETLKRYARGFHTSYGYNDRLLVKRKGLLIDFWLQEGLPTEENSVLSALDLPISDEIEISRDIGAPKEGRRTLAIPKKSKKETGIRDEVCIIIKNIHVIGLNLHLTHQTCLPDNLDNLTKLKSLVLILDQKTEPPKILWKLVQLEKLELYHLNFVPEAVGNLINLKNLTLISNQPIPLPHTISLLKLEQMNLSGFSSLPKSFGSLTNLKHLILQGKQLPSLPETIGHLISLEQWNFFGLEGKNFPSSYFPETVGQLNLLRRLNLSSNQLTILPESIGYFKRVKELNLEKNQLKILPETIGELSSLEVLELQNNQLEDLADSIGDLSNLRQINLSYNRLKNLPESFAKLKRLEKLDLSYNRLTTIPRALMDLTNLQVLNLYPLNIETVPEFLNNLTKLHMFRFSLENDEYFPKGRVPLNLWFPIIKDFDSESYINNEPAHDFFVSRLEEIRNQDYDEFLKIVEILLERTKMCDPSKEEMAIISVNSILLTFSEFQNSLLQDLDARFKQNQLLEKVCTKHYKSSWLQEYLLEKCASDNESDIEQGIKVMKYFAKEFPIAEDYEDYELFYYLGVPLKGLIRNLRYVSTEIRQEIVDFANNLSFFMFSLDTWESLLAANAIDSSLFHLGFESSNISSMEVDAYRFLEKIFNTHYGQCNICGIRFLKRSDDTEDWHQDIYLHINNNHNIIHAARCDYCTSWICCGYIVFSQKEPEKSIRKICLFCLQKKYPYSKIKEEYQFLAGEDITNNKRDFYFSLSKDNLQLILGESDGSQIAVLHTSSPDKYWEVYQTGKCRDCGKSCQWPKPLCCHCYDSQLKKEGHLAMLYRRGLFCCTCATRQRGICVGCDHSCNFSLEEEVCCICGESKTPCDTCQRKIDNYTHFDRKKLDAFKNGILEKSGRAYIEEDVRSKSVEEEIENIKSIISKEYKVLNIQAITDGYLIDIQINPRYALLHEDDCEFAPYLPNEIYNPILLRNLELIEFYHTPFVAIWVLKIIRYQSSFPYEMKWRCFRGDDGEQLYKEWYNSLKPGEAERFPKSRNDFLINLQQHKDPRRTPFREKKERSV